MKKFIFTLFLMVAAVTSYGQQTTVEGSKLFNNTSVTVYGGATGWINPFVTNETTFLNGIRPSVGVAADKWFTPVVGAEVFFETSANSFPFNSVQNRWTAFDFMNLGLNGEVNLNNLFSRYDGKPDRIEFVPFVGIGWGHGFTNQSGSNLTPSDYQHENHTSNYITSDAGVGIDFNLGEKRAWQINVRPSINYLLGGEGLNVQFNADRAYANLQVGVTYKFGYKNSIKNKTHNFTKAYTVAEYNALQDKYNALEKAYNDKPKEIEKIVDRVVERFVNREVPVEVFKYAFPVPHFNKGVSIVDVTTIAALDELVTEINKTDKKYTIVGYASEEGDRQYNKELSLRRATTIKNYLVKHGVDESRLEAVGAGSTNKFGKSYADNRRVMVVEK